MPRNVEIKAGLRPDQVNTIREQALALSSAPVEQLYQADTFYHAVDQRLKLREFGNGSAELIAYSRSDQSGPSLSSYCIYPCSNPAALHQALSLALGVRGQVRKTREVILIGQTRVHLDSVDGLGAFVELEVVLESEQSVSEGEAVAAQLLDVFGVSADSLQKQAYIDLLEHRNNTQLQ